MIINKYDFKRRAAYGTINEAYARYWFITKEYIFGWIAKWDERQREAFEQRPLFRILCFDIFRRAQRTHCVFSVYSFIRHSITALALEHFKLTARTSERDKSPSPFNRTDLKPLLLRAIFSILALAVRTPYARSRCFHYYYIIYIICNNHTSRFETI